jgi:hypothetical protein
MQNAKYIERGLAIEVSTSPASDAALSQPPNRRTALATSTRFPLLSSDSVGIRFGSPWATAKFRSSLVIFSGSFQYPRFIRALARRGSGSASVETLQAYEVENERLIAHRVLPTTGEEKDSPWRSASRRSQGSGLQGIKLDADNLWNEYIKHISNAVSNGAWYPTATQSVKKVVNTVGNTI